MMRFKKTDFIDEKRVAKFLGVTEETITSLRQKQQLPFISVTKKDRLYYFPDLYQWLFERKTTLGSETENESG